MTTLKITGKFLGATAVKAIGANGYTVRNFYIEVENNNPQYPNTPEFQLTGNNVTLVDKIEKGQEIEISFRIDGRKWEKDGRKGVITQLNAYRISVIRRENPVATSAPTAPPEPVAATNGAFGSPSDDDLPF